MSERLPTSVLPDDVAATREKIRCHHWTRHFQCLKSEDSVGAKMHRELAESVQAHQAEIAKEAQQ